MLEDREYKELGINSEDEGRVDDEVVIADGRYSLGDNITEEEGGCLGEGNAGCEGEAEGSSNRLLLGK